jgi:hypothetical protein
MTFTFQPQFIKQDSPVPLRMMVVGWIIGVAALLFEDPVESRVGALIGLTLLGFGLIFITLFSARMWRMLIGSGAGAVAAWLGYRFGIDQRLIPILEDEPLDVFDRAVLAPIALGASVLAIGLGGLLEALRAQSEPGHSPIAVRIALILIGAFTAAAVCSLAGVSQMLTIAVVAATALLMAALAWLRRERPVRDFQPSP